MYRFFVPPEQIGERTVRITGTDVNHIRNVLRMKPGEEIRVCTGSDDRDIRCRIEKLSGDSVEALIIYVEHTQAELPSRVTLYQGLPKSDKMDMIIQKNVELGIFRIVPVEMARCVMKLRGDKALKKVQRWNAISESAAKQSKRMIIPSVSPVMTMKQAAEDAQEQDLLLFPYELAQDMDHTRQVLSGITPGASIGIFIGPEGGFEPEEAQRLEKAGAREISLGARILRTETAGMALMAALELLLDGRSAEESLR